MMKNIISAIFSLFLLAVAGWGQTVPEGMNFQALARDAGGAVLVDQPVRLQVILRAGGPDGQVVFRESHPARTNELGLFNLVIGEGSEKTAMLSDVPWGTGNIWMEIGLDAGGGTDYRIIHSARLLAVPYAFYAGSAEKLVQTKTAPDCRPGGLPFWPMTGHPAVDTGHFVGTTNQEALVFRTNNLERMRISGDSQKVFIDGVLWVPELDLKANPQKFSSGKPDDTFGSYPVRIRNARQGIAVKLNNEDPNASNNFMAFFDSSGTVLGRIEGQTEPEFLSSYAGNFLGLTAGLINSALPVGEGIACLIQNAVQGGSESGEATTNFIWAAKNTAEFAWTFAWTWLKEVGVSYSSGGADYAEWLEKANPEDDLYPAEIVGVRAGKVSRNTTMADQVMVISSNPVVLGNSPPREKRAAFARTAFLGQVPVRLAGPVRPGDLILPSGRNDGWGIAVRPDQIRLEDYAKIVGVAWSEADQSPGPKLVNTAIGLTSRHLVAKVVEEQTDLEDLRERLGLLLTYLRQKAAYEPARASKSPYANPGLSNAEVFKQWITDNEELLGQHVQQLKTYCETIGLELSQRPSLKAFLDNPSLHLEKFLADPRTATLLDMLDKELMMKGKTEQD